MILFIKQNAWISYCAIQFSLVNIFFWCYLKIGINQNFKIAIKNEIETMNDDIYTINFIISYEREIRFDEIMYTHYKFVNITKNI